MQSSPLLFALVLASVSTLHGAIEPPEPRVTAKERQQGFRDTRILAQPRLHRAAEATAAESRLGLRLRRQFQRLGDLRVLEVGGADTAALIRELRATGHFEFVEPDYLRKPQLLPDDPRLVAGEQWALVNTGQDAGKVGADVGAAAAWEIRTDASDVIVAVIDSGIRATHEDLGSNLWHNPREIAENGVDDDQNGYVDDVHGINSLAALGTLQSGLPDDDSGHGTSVSGVLAAVGNNGKGIAGVAWRAKIMALKFDDAAGSASVSNAIECVDYAIANGAKIINISYGSYGYSQAEYNAIKRARDAGIIVVTAAGNDRLDNDVFATYPANYALDNIVSVAATDRNDALSDFSSFGAGLVELAAPGSAIVTTAVAHDAAYDTYDGTSFSSPLVAAAFALVRAQFPTEDYRAAVNRVLGSVDRLPGLAGKVQTAGRLNIGRALAASSSRPFNDDFAGRAAIAGSGVALRTHTRYATAEPAEPAHAGSAASGTLWWSWTATVSGPAAVETSGSSFDTVLAVYTGETLETLTAVGSNDDTAGTAASRVEFQASAGQTYHLAIGGKNATGSLVVAVGYIPANDAFASAEVLTGPSTRVTGFNSGTGGEASEPRIVPAARHRTAWYRWTAPTNGYFSISVFAYGFDAVLGVYTGSQVNGLTLVDSASQEMYNEPAVITAIAGVTYQIQVDSLDGGTGAFAVAIVDALGLPGYFPIHSSPAAHETLLKVFSTDTYGFMMFMRISPFILNYEELGGTVDVHTPAVGSDGSIYIGDEHGYVYGFGPDNQRTWQNDAGMTRVTSSPALGADGAVYVHTDDGFLRGYYTDGTIKWTAPVPGESYSSPAIGADGTIYIGSDDEHLYALSPTDGALKWKFKADGDIYSSPAIDANGAIYFGTLNGKFYSVSPAGEQRWAFTAGGAISSSAAIAADGTCYFGCYDRYLYAVSAQGTLQWKYEMGNEVRGSSPAISSFGIVYIGNYDGYVHAVTREGTPWRVYATGAYIRSSPMIFEGTLFIGSGDARLYLADINSTLAAAPWPMHRQNVRRTGRRPGSGGPVLFTSPASVGVALGAPTTLAANAGGGEPLTFQWYHNGTAIPGATRSNYATGNTAVSQAGSYTVAVSNSLGTAFSVPAVIGITSAEKVVGSGAEFAANISHPNGNIFDQVLVQGPVVTVTADPGQVLRMSYLDLQDDIVQVEFAGSGTLTLLLEEPSGPAKPVKYNQDVDYMRGRGSIIIDGANETTYLSVFTVGRSTAVNQALFKSEAVYDGFADIGYVAIRSQNGKFGGMRSGNTRFSSAKGFAGLYAPNVNFQDVIFIHDIEASGNATPMFVIGGASETRLTGGDLQQPNNLAVQVRGLTQLKLTAGTDSHGNLHPAQTNKGRLERDGVDVTAGIIVNPPSGN